MVTYIKVNNTEYPATITGEQAGGKITLQYLPHELAGNYFKAV